LSYLFERGKKRQHRLKAAKDATVVTRLQVRDNERSLTFQVAQLFINVQLAESTLDLARQDLKSFAATVTSARNSSRPWNQRKRLPQDQTPTPAIPAGRSAGATRAGAGTV